MECSICLREYSEIHPKVDPRVLGCGHTLCLDCIKQSLSSQGTLQCPFDRKTFNKINPEQLPRNFGLIEHIESITNLKMQLKAQEAKLQEKEVEEDNKSNEIFAKIEKMQKKIAKQQKKLEKIIGIQEEAKAPDIIIHENYIISEKHIEKYDYIHIKPNEAKKEINLNRNFQDVGLNFESQPQDLAVEESNKIESKKEILLPLALFFMMYCLVFLPFVLK